MTICVEAYAKVNLYLHVCGKRENGYHELDSLIVFAQTGDLISVYPDDHLSLEITGEMASFIDGDIQDNLVMKAARGLQTLCKTDQGARIVLDKRLPVAAGIGGGSGDAAATLKALCQMWSVFPDPKGMDELALSLGADVPVCMKAHANHVGGIGEVITPLPPLPECWMVLVNPMVAVSTPAVFKARTGAFSPALGIYEINEYETLIAEMKQRHNDLFDPAIGIAPKISQVIEALENQNGCDLARMSGSGATCFGLFATKEMAEAALNNLKTAHSLWWSACGKII